MYNTPSVRLSLAGAAWLHQARFYSLAPLVLALLMALSGLLGLVRLRVERFFYAIPEAAVYELRTAQGVRVWVPRASNLCWAHELPCTPYVNWAALARMRWPARAGWRDIADDPHLKPPMGWTPTSGVYPRSH